MTLKPWIARLLFFSIAVLLPLACVGVAHLVFGVNLCASKAKQSLECNLPHLGDETSRTHTMQLPDIGSPVLLANGNYEFYVDGQRYEAPAGSVIELERNISRSEIGEQSEESRSGTVHGPELRTNDASAAKEFKYESPSLDLGAMTSIGGFTEFTSEIKINNSKFLYILGGIGVFAGIGIIIWAGRMKLGLALIGGGVGIIVIGVVIDQYPWLFLLVLLGVGGYVVYMAIDAKNSKQGTAAVNVLTMSTNEIKVANDTVKQWFSRFKNNLRPNIIPTPGATGEEKQSIFQAIENAFAKTEEEGSITEKLFQQIKDRVKVNADRETKEYIEKAAP